MTYLQEVFGISGVSQDKIDSPSIAYQNMQPKWCLIADLLGGTLAMRNAADKWLPKETKEEVKDYLVRLSRSILYNATKDTIKKVQAKPFTRPIIYEDEDNQNEFIKRIFKNADRQGNNLDKYSKECFGEALKWGMVHVLVEYPQVPKGMSLADQRNLDIRPYFVTILPSNILGFRSEKTSAGVEELTQVRIKECRIEGEGYATQKVEYIRVYEKKSWELYRKAPGETEYTPQSSGVNTLGEIPLLTFYTTRTDFMQADPTFEDLAWLNIAHWQSSSDQKNLLRVARVPILSATGISEDEQKKGLTLGSNAFLSSTNPDAEFKFVEHTGKAIGAGEKDIAKLEAQMQILGLQPLIEQTGNATATGRAIDESTSHASAQGWAKDFAKFIHSCLELAAKWEGKKLTDKFSLSFFTDFAISMKAGLDVQSLVMMRSTGNLSTRTLLKEMKRRGVLSEDTDIDEELKEIKADPPASVKNVDKTGNPQNQPHPTKTTKDPVHNKTNSNS